MWTLRWVWFLPLCLSCGYAFMFSSLRGKGKDPPGKVPCGGHFRSRQSLPEHAQGWLGSKWLWLFSVFVLLMVLKFRRDSDKNKVQNPPPDLQSYSFRRPLKKNRSASPNRECAFDTLNQLELDLVKFMSKLRDLKVTMTTGSKLKVQHVEIPVDPQSVTIYEIWGEGGYE